MKVPATLEMRRTYSGCFVFPVNGLPHVAIDAQGDLLLGDQVRCSVGLGGEGHRQRGTLRNHTDLDEEGQKPVVQIIQRWGLFCQALCAGQEHALANTPGVD